MSCDKFNTKNHAKVARVYVCGITRDQIQHDFEALKTREIQMYISIPFSMICRQAIAMLNYFRPLIAECLSV